MVLQRSLQDDHRRERWPEERCSCSELLIDFHPQVGARDLSVHLQASEYSRSSLRLLWTHTMVLQVEAISGIFNDYSKIHIS